MFQSIVDAISGSAWSYAIIFGVAAIDAFFPLVPSEATVIAAGVLAAQRRPAPRAGHPRRRGRCPLRRQRLVLGSGGSSASESPSRLFTGAAGASTTTEAHRLLEERGGYIILIARFIPLGRTAVTFSAGSLDWAVARASSGATSIAGVDLGVVRGAARLLRRQDLRGRPLEGPSHRVRARARRHRPDRARALVRKRLRRSS